MQNAKFKMKCEIKKSKAKAQRAKQESEIQSLNQIKIL